MVLVLGGFQIPCSTPCDVLLHFLTWIHEIPSLIFTTNIPPHLFQLKLSVFILLQTNDPCIKFSKRALGTMCLFSVPNTWENLKTRSIYLSAFFKYVRGAESCYRRSNEWTDGSIPEPWLPPQLCASKPPVSLVNLLVAPRHLAGTTPTSSYNHCGLLEGTVSVLPYLTCHRAYSSTGSISASLLPNLKANS